MFKYRTAELTRVTIIENENWEHKVSKFIYIYSAEYRMDKQFLSLLIFQVVKLCKLVNFPIQKIPKFSNLENF